MVRHDSHSRHHLRRSTRPPAGHRVVAVVSANLIGPPHPINQEQESRVALAETTTPSGFELGDVIAETVLASDWLAAHDKALRESIAAEIEGYSKNVQTRFDAHAWGKAAAIARGDA